MEICAKSNRFLFSNTANTRDGGNHQYGRRADDKKRGIDLQGKNEAESNQSHNHRKRRKNAAGKSAFSVQAGGNMRADGRRNEKRDQTENGDEAQRVLQLQCGDGEKRKQSHSEQERKNCSEKNGKKKAFFFSGFGTGSAMFFHKKLPPQKHKIFLIYLMWRGGNL